MSCCHLPTRLWGAVLAVFLAVIPFSSALAAPPQTITANVDVTIPFSNKSALGTLVLKETGTPDHMVENWSFTGQVDGKPASAAGVNLGRWTGSSYVGQVQTISEWDVPGVGKPDLPLPVTLAGSSGDTTHAAMLTGTNEGQAAPSSSANGVVYLTFTTHHHGSFTIPMAVQGADGLPAPFGPNLVLSLTNAANSGPVLKLPRTGDAPQWYNLAALALIVLGCGALATSRTALQRLA